MQTTALTIYVAALLILIEGRLEDKLHYYEYIDSGHIEVHSNQKRSANTHLSKEVRLSAFGRNFTLELSPSTDLFANSFGIAVVHGDGTTDTVTDFNKHNFLTGHVAGDPESQATLHVADDNTITGTFTSDGEEYTIEPASQHADPEDDHLSSTMVAYRRSDIKAEEGSGLCGSVHPEDMPQFDKISFKTFDSDTLHDKRRRRRQAELGEQKTCSLIAVADYRFFAHMGQSNVYSTAEYIAKIISGVNAIYRPTQFSVGAGYGFELHWMVIHDGPTTIQNAYHYNVEKTNWGTAELLQAFGRTTANSEYCLAHLFTSTSMTDSVLGLAYIASPAVGSLGGLCSATGSVNGFQSALNTGWSSSLNGAGSTVLFSHAVLVTAHEFGHNWGSEHDPSSCVPLPFIGDGKYLMYAYSVTGGESNNHKLSDCSIGAISNVLDKKASGCLQVAAAESACGNGRLDAGEECDNGFFGRIGIASPCCSSDCTLNPGAVCSPANKACCVNCQLASPGVQCAGDVDGTCKAASNCDGASLDCPDAPNKPEGTDCVDSGSCVNGVCQSFCEYQGLISCICGDVETSCLRCCAVTESLTNRTTCRVFDSNTYVANGRSCVQGYCENGVCTKVATDLVERLWDLIDKVDIDFVLEAIKTNIVSFVIGITLIIYIPVCIGIWCYDNSRRKKWEKEHSFTTRQDRGLDHDEDKRRILNRDTSRIEGTSSGTGDNLETLSARRLMSRNQIRPMGHNLHSSQA